MGWAFSGLIRVLMGTSCVRANPGFAIGIRGPDTMVEFPKFNLYALTILSRRVGPEVGAVHLLVVGPGRRQIDDRARTRSNLVVVVSIHTRFCDSI